MELESYIDRLNNTIEGLESEQLTITNNIINLKNDYNLLKIDYDKLLINNEIESKKYSKLLMDNVILTNQQNKGVIDKIKEDTETLKQNQKEFYKQKEFLETKLIKFTQDIEIYELDIEKLKDKQSLITKKEKELNNSIIHEEKLNSELSELIKNNIELESKNNQLLKTNTKDHEFLENGKLELKQKQELFENEYNLKVKDLKRREKTIINDKISIDSQWKALKQAKQHIDNLKQGN